MPEQPSPRVAIVYDCLFPINAGGGERVYRKLAELFVEHGSRVRYVTRAQWPPAAPPAATFEIVPVWQGELYTATGVRKPGSALWFALALFRHFKRDRDEYDIVVVSALPVLNVFAVALAVRRRTLLVTDWLEVWTWRQWRGYVGFVVGTIAFLLQVAALRLGDAQTANSEFTAARIRRYRRNASPTVLGLVDVVKSSDTNWEMVHPPFVLFVGRHIAEKRLDALPPALAIARESVPSLTAVVVGTGPETAAVKELTRLSGLSDEVSFLGRVSDEALTELMGTAAVLVNPSEREGFGLVIIEAAAEGTPSVVVAGEGNAAAELIERGINGFVSPSTAAIDLGGAIVQAVEAGARLRASTRSWFRSTQEAASMPQSIEKLLDLQRVSSPTVRRGRDET